VRDRYDLSSLRYVVHGAAPCPVHVKKALIEWWGPIVHEYYAATEGAGTTVGPTEWLEHPGTVGKPVEDRVQIRGADGDLLGTGEVGTIYLRSPDEAEWRFEYLGDPDKTARAYDGDYFTLGDMGYVDEQGYLFLTDRTADVIISGGVNVYPAEVDAVLLEHPAVADACTIGVPNDEWGEEVKAVVERRADEVVSASDLIAWCRDRLAHFKCPRTIDFTDALPRSEAGKLYRRLVRDRYWAGRERRI
jgi:long-chain acyl-CoA synthetase